MATNSNTDKSMDVTPPGGSAPTSSSRPVIVSHRPSVQDPMVKADDSNTDSKEPLSVTRGKVIQPLSHDDGKSSKEATSDKNDSKDSTDSSDESAVLGAVAEQVSAGKKKDANDEEHAKYVEELEKLIESKQYFVPIGAVTRRKNQKTMLMILGVVVVLIGACVAVDVGFIPVPFEVPFDFIPN